MFKVFTGPTVVTTLSISLVWIIYSAIPPYLLLHYNFIGRGATLRWACTLCFFISSLCGIAAITLLWLVYPTQVRALCTSLYFAAVCLNHIIDHFLFLFGGLMLSLDQHAQIL